MTIKNIFKQPNFWKILLKSNLFTLIFLILSANPYLHAGEVDENIPTVTISPLNPSYNEGNSGTHTTTIHVSLNECPTGHDIKLKYYTANGSATTADNDYISTSGTMTFTKNAGSCSTSFTVRSRGDTDVEGNQYFWVRIRNNGTHPNQHFNFAGNHNNVKITLRNDDTAPTPHGADLRVNKWLNNSSDGDKVYDLNEIITFRIRATNRGPDNSTIKVKDVLPAGLTLVSITDNISSHFSCNAATLSCTGTHIFHQNQSVWITVKAKTATAGSYKNVAVVSDRHGNEDTINTGNNRSTRWVTVAPGGTNGASITKTVDNATPNLNTYVNFTLTLTNHGLSKRIALRDGIRPNNISDQNYWGTTFRAFDNFSFSGVPAGVHCSFRTHHGRYLYCYTDSNYANGQSFSVNLRARVIKNNHICNRAHGYRYSWGWSASDTQCLDVYGSYPPTLDPIPDKIAYVGEYFYYYVSNSYADDPDGDTLTYSASNLPPGLSLDASGVIRGRPSDAGAHTYNVTYTVTDHPGNGYPTQSVSRTFNIEVRYPDVLATDNNYNIETNSTLSGNIIRDNTGDGRDTGYHIHVISHSPSVLTGGTLNLQADGSFTFIPNRTFLGQESFTYIIADSRGVTDEGNVTIAVSTDYEDGYQPFVLINPPDTRNVLGNYVIAGNTMECITDSSTDFSGSCTDNNNVISNDFVTKYIDMDGDASTWNSSSSYINLPSSFDKDDKGILWAGLFWQGRFTKDAQYDGGGHHRLIKYGKTSGAGYTLMTHVSTSNISSFDANKIKLKVDSGAYNDVQALTLFSNRNGHGVSYAAYADVTNLIKTAITDEGKHTFTVANLPTAEGWERDPGLYGGWSLAVIYAEDFRGKVRNVSVYSGYDQIEGDAVHGNVDSTIIPISGFKLPLFDRINSTLAIFSGEGEYKFGSAADKFDRVKISNDSITYDYPNSSIDDNVFDAILTGVSRDTIPGHYNNLQNNNAGLDIDYFDISDLMTTYRDLDRNISAIDIKWETNLDTVNPSMMIFAAELYIPKLCYDYSYKQNGITFSEDNNGTEKPYITGERLSTGSPVSVELYLRNEEASDATLKNVTMDIFDINVSQASYTANSTYVTYPHKYTRTHINDSNMTTAADRIIGIPLKEIKAHDALYVDYDLNLVNSEINMPLDGRVNLTLDLLGGISYDLTIYLESMKVCGNDRYAYYPQYNIFNIEDKALAPSNYYDLPTQIVKRVGDYTIKSYNNDTSFTSSKNITAMVAVELINAGKYHDVNASCFEPDNTLSPRVWIPFENNVSQVIFDNASINAAITDGRTSDIITGATELSNASDIYKQARENVAFRVSYGVLDSGNNSLMQMKHGSSSGWQIDDRANVISTYPQCSKNVITSSGVVTNQTSVVCKDNSSLKEVAICMECLYGLNTQLVCSRDNFSVRPKSFRMTLNDQNQSDHTQPKTLITTNNNANTWNLVTGYDYNLNITATNFINDTASNGYFGYFDVGGADGNKSFGLVWQDVPGHLNCNDKEDANSSTHFYNGTADLNIGHSQIGQYKLAMLDKEYTKVDWDSKYMKHHLGAHFLHGIDCQLHSSISLTEGTATAISGQDLSNVNGCEIASNLTSDSQYTDLLTQFYPYHFNTTGLAISAGPTNKSFIYINNLPTLNSENKSMSYNINGTYFAEDYNNSQIENFTTGCFSEDTLMQLNFTYNHSAPATTPFLSASLQDRNTSNTAILYKPNAGPNQFAGVDHNSTTTSFDIDQEKEFYSKDMKGAMDMLLAYNFKRTNDLPLEPRSVKFNDLQIVYKNNPTTLYAEGIPNFVIKGTRILNKNVTFLYGRAEPSKTLYDDVSTNSIQTPISTIVYCSLGLVQCQNRGLPLLGAQTNKTDWWLNLDHKTVDNDGKVDMTIDTNGVLSNPSINIVANATDTGERVSANPLISTRPLTTVINLNATTDKWLIYNPFHPTAIPSPFYRVRFIGSSGWAGHGDTGHVVDANISIKKNQRLGW